MQMIKKIMAVFGLVIAVQSAWFVGTPCLYGAGLSEQEKFLKTLEAIMQKGAFDPVHDAPILKAFITDSRASVGYLFSTVDLGVLFNTFEKAATMTFTENGISSNLMAWLLDNDPVFGNINIRQDVTGKTLLILAVEFNEINLVKLLLSRKGIDVNLQDTERAETALHLAAYNGLVEITELLLQKKADVNARTAANETPLFLATLAKDKSAGNKVVELLLKEDNVDVNVSEKSEGRTPLWQAVFKNNVDVVKLLLARPGIEIWIKDNTHKKTALEYAESSGKDSEIIKVLKEAEEEAKKKGSSSLEQLKYALLALKTKLSELAGKLHGMK